MGDEEDTRTPASKSADILAKIKADAEKRRSLTKIGEKEKNVDDHKDDLKNRNSLPEDGRKVKKRLNDTAEEEEKAQSSKKRKKSSSGGENVEKEDVHDEFPQKKKKHKKERKNSCEMCGDDINDKESRQVIMKKLSGDDKKGDDKDNLEPSKSKDKSPTKSKHSEDGKKIKSKKMKQAKQESLEDKKEDSCGDDDDLLSEEINGKEVGGFTVLGEEKPKTPPQLGRLLPDWLASPSLVSADLSASSPVETLSSLDTRLVEKLKENGIIDFFPVQLQVIPEILSEVHYGYKTGVAGFRPSDLCVSAPTGSGKTLTFVLPIIQALLNRVECKLRALVVLPVRELAAQVYRVFQTYCEGSKLQVGLIAGMKPLHSEQRTLVKHGYGGYESLVDIIVATPGRLVDHITQTKGFDLTALRFLVLDEADRMMELLKQDWLLEVEKAVYSKGRDPPGPLNVRNSYHIQVPFQKLLFSATLSQNPEKIKQLNLFQPKLFTAVGGGTNKGGALVVGGISPSLDQKQTDVNSKGASSLRENNNDIPGKYTMPAELTEECMECTSAERPLLILHFLLNLKYSQILCFTNSKDSAHRLCLLLKLVGGFTSQEVTGNTHHTKMTKAIKKFSQGQIDILVCSDAMARGMDLVNARYVLSYDPPKLLTTYIHRVGRTARAGKEGTAITFVQDQEFYHFKKMTSAIRRTGLNKIKVPKDKLEPLVPKLQAALKKLSFKIPRKGRSKIKRGTKKGK
ncbi:hypothetical protein FSP39_011231 [Pinctada imbricata]|uniref:ATP-dependent RNA helicase n=1 Tax=Pinctada imbricata TaxID=66713 RepID=A0AA88YCP7_PINIB|nr:hypothetical protein FSP39_011231 [Pinctada imbricata]